MVNLIDLGMNVQMTTDVARFTHNQTSNVLSLEANLFNLVGAALKAKGHDVRSVNGGAVGGYQGILFTRDPRLPEPTFDPRSITDDLPVNGVYRAVLRRNATKAEASRALATMTEDYNLDDLKAALMGNRLEAEAHQALPDLTDNGADADADGKPSIMAGFSDDR